MAVLNATKTVVGVFETMDAANRAVSELEKAGFSHDDVSVIANKSTSEYAGSTSGVSHDTAEKTGNVATDAGIGAALGGVGGLLLSFAGLAIPGIGPILAAGPIVAALSGAGIGAVAGGIVGALTESGIPEEEAHYYAEGVRRGHVLVTVRADNAAAERARDILDANGAVDVEGRASNWRDRGWGGYNAGAEPMSADELRREREYYAAAGEQGRQWTRTERDLNESRSPLDETRWPHNTAYDAGSSLQTAEARNADIDRRRTVPLAPQPMEEASRDTGSVVGDVVRPLASERETPSNYSDALENNVRRPDPAVVRAERGFDRAKESAVQSARRLGARIYDTTRR